MARIPDLLRALVAAFGPQPLHLALWNARDSDVSRLQALRIPDTSPPTSSGSKPAGSELILAVNPTTLEDVLSTGVIDHVTHLELESNGAMIAAAYDNFSSVCFWDPLTEGMLEVLKKDGMLVDYSFAGSSSERSGAKLEGANLTGAELTGAQFEYAHLRGAHLAGANLQAAHLRKADVAGADLHGANLRAADLTGADLTATNLHAADLTGANLAASDLRDANLTAANLHAADLRGADLSGADLTDADLSDADLSGAILETPIYDRTALDAAMRDMAAQFMTAFESPAHAAPPPTHSKAGGSDLVTAMIAFAQQRPTMQTAIVTQAQLNSCKSLQEATLPADLRRDHGYMAQEPQP